MKKVAKRVVSLFIALMMAFVTVCVPKIFDINSLMNIFSQNAFATESEQLYTLPDDFWENYSNKADEFDVMEYLATQYRTQNGKEVIDNYCNSLDDTTLSGRIYKNNISDFRYWAGKVAWDTLTLDIAALDPTGTAQKWEKKSTYESIIFNLLDTVLKSDSIIDFVTQNEVKNTVKASKAIADIFKANKLNSLNKIYNAKIDWNNDCLTYDDAISTLSVSKLNKELTDKLGSSVPSKIGKGATFVSDTITIASDINDLRQRLSQYLQVCDISYAMQTILKTIMNNTSEPELKLAIGEVLAVCDNAFNTVLIGIADGTYILSDFAASKFGPKLMSEIITALTSSAIANAVLIASTIGKTACNICFSTDAELEQVAKLGCLYYTQKALCQSMDTLYNSDDYKVVAMSVKTILALLDLDNIYVTKLYSLQNSQLILGMTDDEFNTEKSKIDEFTTSYKQPFLDMQPPGCEKCGENLYWVIIDDTLLLYGYGDMKDYKFYYDDNGLARSNAPWTEYDSQIKNVSVSSLVTKIGRGAFLESENITSDLVFCSVEEVGKCGLPKFKSNQSVIFGTNVSIFVNSFENAVFCESVTLTGETEINGNVVVNENLKVNDSPSFTISEHAIVTVNNDAQILQNKFILKGQLYVNGNLKIASYLFYMDEPSSYLYVAKTFEADSMFQHITNGEIDLLGDCYYLSVEKNNTVRLIGKKKQIITGCTFYNLYNHNPNGIEIKRLVYVNGDIQSDVNPIVSGAPYVRGDIIGDYFNGDLGLAGTHEISNDLTVKGNILIDDNDTTNVLVKNGVKLTVNGDLNLWTEGIPSSYYVYSRFVIEDNAQVDVAGSVFLHGQCGSENGEITSGVHISELYINGYLRVGEYLRQYCCSRVYVQKETSYLFVAKSIVGYKNQHFVFENGNIEILGNISNCNIYGSDRSKLIVNGSEQQNISANGTFGIVEVTNTIQQVSFGSDVRFATLFDHKGSNCVFEHNDINSIMPDYDGDGIKDHADSYPLVGNPCTINVMSNNNEHGTVSDSIETIGGTTVTVKATPSFKYVFSKWTNKNGKTVSTSPEYTFVAKGDDTLKAYFSKRKRNISVSTENGTVVVPKTAEIESFVTVTSITANEGYTYVEGSLLANDQPIVGNKFYMPDEDVVITCEFLKNDKYFELKEKILQAKSYSQTYYTVSSYNNLVATIETAMANLTNDVSVEVANEHIMLLTEAENALVERTLVELVATVKNVVPIGCDLSFSELAVIANYDNGTSETISDYMVSGFDNSVVGIQSVTIIYNEITTTTDIEVVPEQVESIAVYSNPDKTEYFVGENLDLTGFVLLLNYNTERTEQVTEGFVCSTTTFETDGQKEILVSYEDKSTSFMVTVYIPVNSVEILEERYEMLVGQKVSVNVLVEPYNAAYPELVWTTSDDYVLNVSDSGIITALNVGEATVTATAHNGITSSCLICISEPVTYTATFINDGEMISTDDFTILDESLDYPEIEAKEHYEWVWDDHEIIAGDITINGEYVPIVYTATFVAGGIIVDTIEFSVENQSVVAPEIPKKDGYTAVWENYEVTLADFTVNAVYTSIVYTATFTHNGKVIGTDDFTVEDTSLDYPDITEKEHYEWIWDEHSILPSNFVVDGKYVPITYTIEFVSSGKTVKTQSFTIETYDAICAPELTEKVGYNSSWEDWEGKICDLTVNEIYVPIVYSARFWCNGNLIRTSKFTVETKKEYISMPALSKREGYKVVWQDFEIVPNDIDIYGEYVPIEYKATFVADGVVVSTQTFTVETESLDEPPVPQKPGYYARWSGYKIEAKDISVVAKYNLPEVVTVSKRTLDVGETFRLLPSCNFEVTEKSWFSSDSSVATVNQHGKVTAVGKGECEITVTCYGKDSLGNDIQASKVTKIIVNDETEPQNFKQSFREMFNEFFEVKLHELLYNLREFMIVLFRYAY